MTRRGLLAQLALCLAIAGCGSDPSSPSAISLPGSMPLTMTFTPQNQRFAAATEDYRRLWADEGSRIVAILESITGLGFFQGNISAIVYEGVSFSGNRDTPMRLRASYSPDSKRSSLAHELGHRLISQLTMRPSDLDEHRVLDLILYDAWENLWGVEFATRQVQFESGLQGTYESAWRWALLLTKAERAARFASIVQSNRR
jgi:hypothetical protein